MLAPPPAGPAGTAPRRSQTCEGMDSGDGADCRMDAGSLSEPLTGPNAFKVYSQKIAEQVEEEPRRCAISRKCIIWTVGLIAAAAVSTYVHDHIKQFLANALVWVSQFGWLSAVYLALGTVALSIFMLPTFPLMVGAGVIFFHMYGLPWGAVVGVTSIFTGVWFGSMLAFLLGRTLYKDWAQHELNKYSWMEVVNEMIREEGLKVVLLLRMSPMLPAEAFNYACAATPLPTYKYALGCFGSLVPVSFWVISTAQGVRLAEEESGGDGQSQKRPAPHMWLLVIFNVSVFIVLTVALYTMYRKHSKVVDNIIEQNFQEADDQFKQKMKREVRREFTKGMSRRFL